MHPKCKIYTIILSSIKSCYNCSGNDHHKGFASNYWGVKVRGCLGLLNKVAVYTTFSQSSLKTLSSQLMCCLNVSLDLLLCTNNFQVWFGWKQIGLLIILKRIPGINQYWAKKVMLKATTKDLMRVRSHTFHAVVHRQSTNYKPDMPSHNLSSY